MKRKRNDCKLMSISLKAVVRPPWYPMRRVTNERHNRELRKSLEVDGQAEPIWVVSTKRKNEYLLADGYRRVRALEELGRETVRAFVWKGGSRAKNLRDELFVVHYRTTMVRSRKEVERIEQEANRSLSNPRLVHSQDSTRSEQASGNPPPWATK